MKRLRRLFFRNRAEQELDDEITLHLEMETRKNIAAGMSPREAARAARLHFGTDPGAVKDYVRDTRRLGFIETLFHDVRYALRGFRRTPLFALTVIGTIALGLGWNTAAFTIFNSVVLRPIDALDPHSLYGFGWQNPDGDSVQLTVSQLEDLRKAHPGFSAITANFPVRIRLDGRFAACDLVDGEFFQTLDINAKLGRTLLPSDDRSPGGSPAAVLSYSAWQNRFGGAADVLGRKLPVQGHPYEVVGVMPEGFTGLGHAFGDVWVSLSNLAQFEDTPNPLSPDAPAPFILAGRLQPGYSEQQAAAALTAWIRNFMPDRVPRATLMSLATMVPFTDRMFAILTPIAVVFLLVLLSACANVANMMLARAMARQREIGIRLSLGAARGRLIRQLLTESILLAIPSAAVAFVVSQAFIKFSLWLTATTIPAAFLDQATIPPLSPDIHVFWFMSGAAAVVAMLFGLAPALQATRMDVVRAARGDFSSGFRPSRLRNTLVIAQVTVCAFLLICSAVFLRRANRLERLDPGMRSHDVLELDLQPKSRTREIATLQMQPEIAILASSSDPPLDVHLPAIAASGTPDARFAQILYRYASPGYFKTLDIPIVRGRSFSDQEGVSEAAVVVLSESAARKLWPSEDAVGKTLTLAPPDVPLRGDRPPRYRTLQVIGIARDSAVGAIDNPDRSSLFFPTPLQDPRNVFIARVHGEPQHAIRALDAALEQSSSGSVQDIHVLKDYVDVGIWSYQLEFWIFEALGGIALLLTLSGMGARHGSGD